MIKLGERVGAYTFVRELGRGGSGIVYLAEDHALGKLCAIKVLHAHLAKDEIAMERFRREVKSAAAIDHPAIAKCRPLEQLPGDGAWCCVMEYVEAPTLTELCKGNAAPMPLARVIRIVAPICEAFDLLHVLGIVHRDLKPDNVLVTLRNGQDFPRVLDFGIAKSTRANEPGLTRPGGVGPGTVEFMAPEQAKGDPVDRRCDVYSLGVLIYWLLTGGHLPYEVPEGLIYHHQLSEPPKDPRQYVPTLSDAVVNVIRTALAPQRERRHPTMGALGLELAQTHPSGTEILRACAPNLLVVGNLRETFRSPSVPALRAAPWKYEYGQVLGQGGMAEVVRATSRGPEGFAVPCAIKRIRPEHAASPEFAEMFHKEARHCALLEHRNIVKVLDHDVDPSGRWYIAMELVEGVDLFKLAQSGPIPHAVLIFVLCEMLEALDYAHNLPPASPFASAVELAARGDTRGIVHRDISHCNVLVSWLGDVKLSDFGIAKLRNATSAEGSLFIKGKAQYMAPEQARGAMKLDGRADLWSVGVMAWELLTGNLLFKRDSVEASLLAVVGDPIAAPSVVAGVPVPPDLDAITMRLLERDLSKRYQSARDVIADLRRCSAAVANGRDALLSLLAERFPGRVRPVAASHAIPVTPAQPIPFAAQPIPSVAPVTTEGQRAFAVSAPGVPGVSWQVPSTTGHTNGESVAVAPIRRPRRYWPVVFGASAAVVVSIALAARSGVQLDDAGRALAKPKDTSSSPGGSAAASAAMPSPGSMSAASPRAAGSVAPAVMPTPVPVAPASPPALISPPSLVALTVDTTPGGGRIRIEAPNGGVDGRAPLTVQVPSGASIQVRAELDGYQTITKEATVGDNAMSLVVALPAIAGSLRSAKTVEHAGAPRASSPVKPAKQPIARPAEESPPGIIE